MRKAFVIYFEVFRQIPAVQNPVLVLLFALGSRWYVAVARTSRNLAAVNAETAPPLNQIFFGLPLRAPVATGGEGRSMKDSTWQRLWAGVSRSGPW